MAGEQKSRKDVLVLFDVDGTLTQARRPVEAEMSQTLEQLKKVATVGLVSGSDLVKVAEQMGDDVVDKFDYVFPENGLVAYKNGSLVGKESIASYMGEEKLQRFINFCLSYMSKIELPVKRGNFVEFRNGLINVAPPGRSVTAEQRAEFSAFDKEHGIRLKFRQALMDEFPDMGLHFAIGGQISIDAFPDGWDKRFCLKHVEGFKEIHFYGDKTEPGGNDYQLYADPRTIGHAVTCPQDTVKQLKDTFNLNL